MSAHREFPLARLLSYMRPYRAQYLLATLYSVLNKLFDIAPEVLIGVAVDSVVKQEHSWLAQLGYVATKQQLLFLGVLTFFIWAFESLFQYLYSVKWRNLAQTVQHALRLDTYAHVQNLDLAYFENQSTGNLLSILNDDINQLERFLEDGVSDIIKVLVSSSVIGGIFFFLAPSIAVLAVLPVPLIIFGAFFFQHKLASRFLKVREKAGLLGRRLANNLSGIVTIKSFCAEEYEWKQVQRESNEYREANRSAIVWSSLVVPVIRIAILIGFLATLVYGGLLAINGEISVGVYSILIFLTQRLLWPLTELAEITVNYQRSMASVTRVLDLLHEPIHIPHGGAPCIASETRGEIEFTDISFAYGGASSVIEDFSVTIPAGETVAFVGTTGSGKTTLMKLLLRFYKPTKGQILLDGTEISTLNLKDLRRTMAVVSQDVFLFHGTVAENIAYALGDVDRAKIIEAAQMAEADQFIKNLPQGYDTVIGERGQKLSGGQRQRIAIARAVLKDPPILILDEATSAVDNETEMAIQRSLSHIIGGRTTLMIAHRLSTVRSAHKIYVLEKGAIVEQGTHEELVQKGQKYASLWKLQTGQL